MIHQLISAIRKCSNRHQSPATDANVHKLPAQTLSAPVRHQPETPWRVSPVTSPAPGARVIALHGRPQRTMSVRISTDPSDARRTVITGRFAEVCAALDRLVLEQEAAA